VIAPRDQAAALLPASGAHDHPGTEAWRRSIVE
jgi:hypothetical protein